MSMKNQAKRSETRSDKTGNLKIGDIILLKFALKPAKFTGFLSADGVISHNLEVIPRESQVEQGANVLTRSCLFRVENARWVTNKNSEKSDSELKSALGKDLTFGERIQLRHIHSMGFVSIDRNSIANEGGCLQASISSDGLESTWLEILPVNKLRKDGDVIRYTDALYLQSSTERSKYYLHCNDRYVSPDARIEVNAGGTPSCWKFRRYMNFNTETLNYVITGDSFRIYHRISDGYLTGSQGEIIGEVTMPEVYVEKNNRRATSLWELQRVATFVGGTALWTELFRIKHLATGYFLCAAGLDVILVPGAEEEGTLFYLVPDVDVNENQVRFNTILTIMSYTGKFLRVNSEASNQQLWFSSAERQKLPISLADSRKDYAGVAFLLEDSKEVHTAHVYKLLLAIPHMVEFYSSLKEELKVSETDPIGTDSRLKKSAISMKDFIMNLSSKVVNKTETEVDLVTRQNSMREMGIIGALITLSDFIIFAMNKLMPSKSSTKLRKRASFNDGHSSSFLFCISYLEDLLNEIYRLIYDSIKGNQANCSRLQAHEEKLVKNHTHNPNTNLGKVLREIFKFIGTSSVFSKERFSRWFNDIEPISARDRNGETQALLLDILKHLCEFSGVGLPNYQRLAIESLSSKDFVPVKFTIVDQEPALDFDYPSELGSKFFSSNPDLEDLREESLVEVGPAKMVIKLSNFSNLPKAYIKYVASAIDFYANLCLDRHRQGIKFVSQTLGASLETLIAALECTKCSYKITAGYVKLLKVLYVDIDPYIPYSYHQSLAFAWDTEVRHVGLQVEDELEYLETPKQLVMNFWHTHKKFTVDEFPGALKLIINYIQLTRVLIDLNSSMKGFTPQVITYLCAFIIPKKFRSKNWCTNIVHEVKAYLLDSYTPSLEYSLGEITAEVIETLRICLMRKTSFQLELMVRLFRQWRENNQEYLIDNGFYPEILDDDTLGELDHILADPLFNINFSIRPVTVPIESMQDPTDDDKNDLNNYLLELLFEISKTQNTELRRKTLRLMLQDINERKVLWKEMKEAEFLTDETVIEMFDSLITKSVFLLENAKTLLQMLEEHNIANEHYETALKSAINLTFELNENLQMKNISSYWYNKHQNMMRHSGVHHVLIMLLKLPLGPQTKLLLRNCLKVLFKFCYNNKENQKLLFEHIEKFIAMIGSGCGSTKLISEILVRHRNSALSQRVLKYIFQVIEQKNNQYHLLNLLSVFVEDENHQLVPQIQMQILKNIFTNKKICAMHTQSDNFQDFLNPKIQSTPEEEPQRRKFHISIIKCIIACTYNNRFGILQGRKLLSFSNLKKTIKKPQLSLHFKKIYLRYLYQVYMVETEVINQALTVNIIHEIFEDVLIKDLMMYREMLQRLVPLARLGLYDNIKVTQMFSKWTAFKRILLKAKVEDLEMVDDYIRDKKALAGTDVEITPEDQQTLDYWFYLSGHQSWHSAKDGLLHIIIDMFNSNSSQLSSEMLQVCSNLKSILSEMIESLKSLEEDHSDLDFSNLILIVNTCLASLPKGPEKYVEEPAELNALIVAMRDYMVTNSLSLEDIFSYFDVNGDGDLELKEFKDTARRLFRGVPEVEIARSFKYLDANGDGVIKMSEFTRCVRRYGKVVKKYRFEPRRNLMHTMVENTNDRKIKQEYNTEFLQKLKPIFKGNEMNVLVDRIRRQILEVSIKTKDVTILKDFVSNLGLAFKDKENKLYLIIILQKLIPEHEPNRKKLQQIQTVMSEAGVLQKALDIVNDENDFVIRYNAILLLVSLLQYGNLNVQMKLLTLLKASENLHIFSYIRSQLRLSRDRIVDRAKKILNDQPARAAQKDLDRNSEEFMLISEECPVVPFLVDKSEKHVIHLVQLIQLCCENCYLDFQEFIRSQEDPLSLNRNLSINLVNELAQFLINVKEISNLLLNDAEARKIIPMCFEAMIDLCRGPCAENQTILGTNRKLYKFINIMLDVHENFKPFPKYLNQIIKFLKVLIEGELNEEIAEMMVEEIRLKKLSELAIRIYTDNIHNNLDKVIQQWVEGEDLKTDLHMKYLFKKVTQGGLAKKQWKIILTGFDIVIIFLRLKQALPNKKELNYLDYAIENSQKERYKGILSRVKFLGGREESLLDDIFKSCKNKRVDINIDSLAYEFYLSLIAMVEIDRNGALELCYFKVPSMITYLSPAARDSFLNSINRNTQEEKIKSFFRQSEKYQEHMRHLQLLSRVSLLAWWASKTKSIENVSFVIIVIINLILLSSVEAVENVEFQEFWFSVEPLLLVLGSILVILSIFTYIFFLIENYPVILYDYEHKSQDVGLYSKPSLIKLRGSVLMKYYVDAASTSSNDKRDLTGCNKLLYILLHPVSIYSIFYIVFALLGLVLNPLFYSVLLLDMLRRSDDLQNILKAITQNKRQLGLTTLLGLIVVYIFGVVGFLWFSQYYVAENDDVPMNTYCGDLLECVVSTLNVGVRAGGGIGDFLMPAQIDENRYIVRQFFDLLFFMIVIIILLNIIFGIIIDTFAELRDKRKEIEKDNRSVCFVCGREKYEFELRGSGWNEHIQVEHNPWAYLAYIIYIKTTPLPECDGIEKYVKQKIDQSDVSFFPKTARCLLEAEEEGEEEKQMKQIQKQIRAIENSLINMHFRT